jgi:ubiquinone/menaquinone biosynthesis C-methylase UbiE
MSSPTSRNPQAVQMADESMVRGLAAQAEAIWPLEEPFYRRYQPTAILDVGCGTGEISSRLATLFPAARVVGVDVLEAHLALARARYAAVGDRLTFQIGDAYRLPFADRTFDLVVCRHVLQAIPDAPLVLAELVRVCAPGGYLHIIAEDYGMIFAAPARVDIAEFWHTAPRAFAKATGTDLHVGRNIYHHLRALPVDDIAIHYLAIDTLRVPRETLAAIFTAWRDGYALAAAEVIGVPHAQARDYFEATIECVRDPDGFALWLLPLAVARVRA